MKKNKTIKKRNIYTILGILFVGLLLAHYLNMLPMVTYSANWVRVIVEDSDGSKLDGIKCRIEYPDGYEQTVYTDNYGEATFKGDGVNGAYPVGIHIQGYCQCCVGSSSDCIKHFDGYTQSGTYILIRHITCPAGATPPTTIYPTTTIYHPTTTTEYCVSHYSRKCYSGDVYWYDSCNHREEKKEDCGSKTCSNGVCVTSPVTTTTTIYYPTTSTTIYYPTTTTTQADTCGLNEILVSGSCVCKSGYSRINGVCTLFDCGVDRVMVDGVCVCKPDTIEVGSECYPNIYIYIAAILVGGAVMFMLNKPRTKSGGGGLSGAVGGLTNHIPPLKR